MVKCRFPRLLKYCKENGFCYHSVYNNWKRYHRNLAEDDIIAAYEHLRLHGELVWRGKTTKNNQRKYTLIDECCTKYGFDYRSVSNNYVNIHSSLTEEQVVEYYTAKALGKPIKWQDGKGKKKKVHVCEKLYKFCQENGLDYDTCRRNYLHQHKTVSEDEAIDYFRATKLNGEKRHWADFERSQKTKAPKERKNKPLPEGEIKRIRDFLERDMTSVMRKRLESEERISIEPVTIDGLTYTEKIGSTLIGRATKEHLARLDAICGNRKPAREWYEDCV